MKFFSRTLLLAAGAAFAASGAAWAQDTIVLGAAVSLTGKYSTTGNDTIDG
jgi:hypothetical protein